MKIYPTQFEITDDMSEYIICRLDAFDDVAFTVQLEQAIYTHQDLKRLAKALKKCEKLLKNGIHEKEQR